jgi:hypothetical protein
MGSHAMNSITVDLQRSRSCLQNPKFDFVAEENLKQNLMETQKKHYNIKTHNNPIDIKPYEIV